MEPESLKHNQHLQMNLDKLRHKRVMILVVSLYMIIITLHHQLNGNMFQVTQMIDINLSF